MEQKAETQILICITPQSFQNAAWCKDLLEKYGDYFTY